MAVNVSELTEDQFHEWAVNTVAHMLEVDRQFRLEAAEGIVEDLVTPEDFYEMFPEMSPLLETAEQFKVARNEFYDCSGGIFIDTTVEAPVIKNNEMSPGSWEIT